MKTQIQKIIGLLTISSLLFVSCETVDFGDENLNPNAISKANTGALITGAMRNIPGIVSSVNPLLLSQQVSEITYNEDSCYETIQWNFDGFYSGPLMDLQTVININNSENAADYSSSGSVGMQKGVSHLLRVYMLQAMTNMWGAIPYSEALQGVDVLKPSFDDQSAVYAGLMTEIDAALGFLDGGGLSGDFMFNGNAAKWAQFGNTMKMVMALRMADADPSAAEAAFKSAVAGGVLTSNADNIHYPYTTSDDNDSPWQDRFQSREDFAASDVMVDHLFAMSDPRLAKYAAPVVEANGDTSKIDYVEYGGQTYAGMPYGVLSPGILQTKISFLPSSVIYDGTAAGGMLYNYAQVCFSYAEAHLRGWTGLPGSAQLWYEYGIAASHAQWGVSTADAVAYLGTIAPVSMETMATEKWVALYMQGHEAWSEWRRLDYPVLTRATDALTGTGIPMRYGYGANTASSNKANHDAAVAKISGYSQDSKVWWDTK
jgi:hypothetical protein